MKKYFVIIAILAMLFAPCLAGADATVTKGNRVITGDLYIGGSIQTVDDIKATRSTPALFILPEKTPVNAVAASGKLVSTGTAVADGEKVIIGATVYTFRTALSTTPAVPYEVLIGVSAAAQMTNLTAAIMATAGAGTTYGTGTVEHPTVTAAVADTDDVDLTAKTKGVVGNLIATTDDSDQLSWGSADVTLVDGIDGTVGVANETCADATYIYHAIAANTIADANWRRIELVVY